MSGGVDSAVAAYLLKESGYEVIGLTLRIWMAEDGSEGRCCAIDEARRISWKLNIPYYAINCISNFREYVTEPFVKAYTSGLTPNPCIECNRYVKWERMIYYANVLGADFVATGHYASVVHLKNGRYSVQVSKHAEKDQTYMLYKLTQDQLSRTLMPLGEYSKDEVRKLAKQFDLSVSQKPDSQEICFVTEGNYSNYIEDNVKTKLAGVGHFVDEDGNILGNHKGIIHYTPGQRKGLGIALGYPAYVKKINVEKNEVVLCKEESLYCRELLCTNPNFMSINDIELGNKIHCMAKIRYHHKPQLATVEKIDKINLKVIFDQSVKAPAPGQSAVFYDKNNCIIAGGIISEFS